MLLENIMLENLIILQTGWNKMKLNKNTYSGKIYFYYEHCFDEEAIEHLKTLLDEGKTVNYNEEWGVGSIKKGKKGYILTHYRWGDVSKEYNKSFDYVLSFLREFYD